MRECVVESPYLSPEVFQGGLEGRDMEVVLILSQGKMHSWGERSAQQSKAQELEQVALESLRSGFISGSSSVSKPFLPLTSGSPAPGFSPTVALGSSLPQYSGFPGGWLPTSHLSGPFAIANGLIPYQMPRHSYSGGWEHSL